MLSSLRLTLIYLFMTAYRNSSSELARCIYVALNAVDRLREAFRCFDTISDSENYFSLLMIT